MTENRGRIYLFGAKIPAEIPALVKTLRQIDDESFAVLVEGAMTMLTSDNAITHQFEAVAKQVEDKWIAQSYPGILLVLQKALRIPSTLLKKKDFIADLSDISIPENFQKPFCEVLFHDRLNVRLHEELFFPAVTSFRWRVDVAISTTALNRVLEPSIIMSVKTSEDEEHLFEVSKEKFHELRYAVAEVLSHMQQIEKRSVLKIDG